MKKITSSLADLLELLLLVLCLLLFASGSPAWADSQGLPSTIGEFTNLPAFFTNATTTVNYEPFGTNAWPMTNTVQLRATGLAFQETFQGSNTTTGPITTWFYPTIDGTNYASSAWATLSAAANGTNIVVASTNWDRYKLQGFLGMSVVFSNGTGNGVWFNSVITNLGLTFTNLVNGGAFYNRPNQ